MTIDTTYSKKPRTDVTCLSWKWMSDPTLDIYAYNQFQYGGLTITPINFGAASEQRRRDYFISVYFRFLKTLSASDFESNHGDHSFVIYSVWITCTTLSFLTNHMYWLNQWFCTSHIDTKLNTYRPQSLRHIHITQTSVRKENNGYIDYTQRQYLNAKGLWWTYIITVWMHSAQDVYIFCLSVIYTYTIYVVCTRSYGPLQQHIYNTEISNARIASTRYGR